MHTENSCKAIFIYSKTDGETFNLIPRLLHAEFLFQQHNSPETRGKRQLLAKFPEHARKLHCPWNAGNAKPRTFIKFVKLCYSYLVCTVLGALG